jgi:protein SCO1/2
MQEVPAMLRDVGIEQRLGQSVPADLPLEDERGNAAKLGDYLGRRPLVLSLAYYRCPMLCRQSLGGLATSLRGLDLELGDDYEVLTVSFDPRDTAEDARATQHTQAERTGLAGAEAGWHFFTAEQAAIERLTEAVGFGYRYDEQRGEYAHASAIMVLTPDGRLSRYFLGIEYPARDLRLALVEASQGAIGTLADRLLLYCYRYDPAQGRYSLAVLQLVRVAALATLAALLLLIVLLRRRPAEAS